MLYILYPLLWNSKCTLKGSWKWTGIKVLVQKNFATHADLFIRYSLQIPDESLYSISYYYALLVTYTLFSIAYYFYFSFSTSFISCELYFSSPLYLLSLFFSTFIEVFLLSFCHVFIPKMNNMNLSVQENYLTVFLKRNKICFLNEN